MSRLPDGIVCNSQPARLAHEAFGYDGAKMRVILNGVDTGRFRPDPECRPRMRHSWGVPPSAFVAGHLARWDPQKDHGTFVQAVGTALARGWAGYAVMAGPGVNHENATLSRWIKATGAADRFRLLGAVDDPAVFLAGLDAACLTSVGESSPYALAEAMACGVPCVATSAGDTKTLLDQVGWIVKPRDTGAFAQALMEVTALDPVERNSRALAGRERIQKDMSLGRMAADYARLYAHLAPGEGVGVGNPG